MAKPGGRVWETIDPRELAELAGLANITRADSGIMASCPAHAGQTGDSPPLSIDNNGDGAVVFCHNCKYSAGASGLIALTQGLASTTEGEAWLEERLGFARPAVGGFDPRLDPDSAKPPDMGAKMPKRSSPKPAQRTGEGRQVLAEPRNPEPTRSDYGTAPPIEVAEWGELDPTLGAQMLDRYAAELALSAVELAAAGLIPVRRNGKLALRLPAYKPGGEVYSFQDTTRADANGKRPKLSASKKSAPIWGLDELAGAQIVLLVEGFSDYLIAHAIADTRAGWAAVGSPGARVLGSAGLAVADLAPKARLLVIADADPPGISGAIEAAQAFGGKEALLIPPPGTDLADLHRANAAAGRAEATTEAIERAAAEATHFPTGRGVAPLVAATPKGFWPAETSHVRYAEEVSAERTRYAQANPPAPEPRTNPLSGEPVDKPAEAGEIPDSLEARLGLIRAQDPASGEAYDLWNPDFDSENRLKTVRARASKKYLSPHALLAVILAEHAASVAHDFVLPPPEGNNEDSPDAGSPLCLFFSIVAPPATGKSRVSRQGRVSVIHHDHDARTTSTYPEYFGDDRYLPIQVSGAPVSGEALAAKLMAEIKVPSPELDEPAAVIRKPVRHRCRYKFGEIGQLLNAAERTGSSLRPMLRDAWSGEELSTLTATEDRTRVIPELSYSIGLTALAQPKLAGELLRSTELGDAQRWVWIPANYTIDPDAKNEAEELAKANGGRLPRIDLAHWHLDNPSYGTFQEIIVDRTITEELAVVFETNLQGYPVAARAAEAEAIRKEREITGENENPHATLSRLRIAIGVARICGLEPKITRQLWHWAGAFLSIDRQTRELLADYGAKERSEANSARRSGQAEDHLYTLEAEATRSEERIAEATRRAADTIYHAAAKKNEPITPAEANRALSASLRRTATALGIPAPDLRDLALSSLTDSKEMEELPPEPGQTATRYKLTGKARKL